MTKSELVTSVSAMTGMPQEAALRAVNAAINTITDAIGKGEPVVLPGFGTFSRKHRNARKGINPQTREAVDIPETYVPSFKPGKTLKEAAKGE